MKVALPYLFLFLLLSDTYSQQLPITVYSSRNGALFSGANSVFQDSNGWMWFTNSYDVVKYDGHAFTTFPPSAPSKMDFCFRVMETGKELWVLAEPQPMKIVGDSLHPLRIKGKLPGIVSNAKMNNIEYFLADGGLFVFEEGKFQEKIIDSTLVFSNGESLFPYHDSLLITYAWRKKFFILNPVSGKVFTSPLPVNSICQHPDGRIFILVKEKGIFELSDIQPVATGLKPVLIKYFNHTDSKAEQFEIDAKGNFWIGVQDKYLMKVLPDKSTVTYNETDGLPSLWFYNLFRDRENNIWIAMNNGLCKISNTHWDRFTKNQGLFSNYTSFIMEGPGEGKVFIGTYNGLNLISNKSVKPVTQNHLPFLCQHLFRMEDTYFFLRDSALYSCDFDTQNTIIHHEIKLSDLPGKGLQLEADTNATLFIATDHGMFAWKDHHLIDILDGDQHYHCILVDHQQQLWAGDFSGKLSVYNIGYKKNIPTLSPIILSTMIENKFNSIRQVRALAEDPFGNIYAGTRYSGLYSLYIKDDKISDIRHWTEKDQLNSNSIWGISTDEAGNCWVATAKGLNRILHSSGKVTDVGIAARIYQAASVFVSPDQNIWIATHPGIVLLGNPTNADLPFTTFITNISVNGRNLSPDSDGNIPYSFPHIQNNISLDFSSNTFINEDDIQYTYRLLRTEKGDWSALNNMHVINYPSLTPGVYHFQVKAKNNTGSWSRNVAAWDFEILHPFWQRSWFIILVILIVSVLIYALYRYRISHLMKLHQMRNNISRNLHDDIGASLSNINILNTLTHRHLQDKAKAESYLEQASEDIQRISESLSDIVWNVNPLNDDLDHLFSHMKRYAADMLEGKNITSSLIFPAHGRKIQLPMEKRRDFFLIFKEAINNLIKHSGATEAFVELKEDNNTLFMSIKDNGVGFDDNFNYSGNGLANMHHRARVHQADFTVNSSAGKGTTVELQMKIR